MHIVLAYRYYNDGTVCYNLTFCTEKSLMTDLGLWFSALEFHGYPRAFSVLFRVIPLHLTPHVMRFVALVRFVVETKRKGGASKR